MKSEESESTGSMTVGTSGMMSSEGSDNEEPPRGTKRVRLACLNCRRKKTKCPGETPVCSFCARLGQECQYADRSLRGQGKVGKSSQGDPQYGELIDRIAHLEQKLKEMSANEDGKRSDQQSGSQIFDMTGHPSNSSSPSTGHLSTTSSQPLWQHMTGELWNQAPFPVTNQDTSFGLLGTESLPSLSYIQAALGDFFRHSHNQPYSFFNEASFRIRFVEGIMPDYLLLATVASAGRFANSSTEKLSISKTYAQRAWELVSKQVDSDAQSDLSVVQAATLLAVYDFTACRNRSAWRKIGIAARLAQDLKLMLEPDPSLSYRDQEEHRRTFWSIYLLDSLATCGRARPPVFQDHSCKLALPSTEFAFREGRFEDANRIYQVLGDKCDEQLTLSPFAKVITIATVLGRCAQYMLQDVNIRRERPPWDANSDYASINSSLMELETHLEFRRPILEAFNQDCMAGKQFDRYSAEHVAFSYALYHLSHCLLNHHFLLRRRLEPYAAKVPSTFSFQASEDCRRHAQLLTHLLNDARELGCELRSSFYGYCALVAGTINALHQYSDDHKVRLESMSNLSINIGFLQAHTHYWDNALQMLDELQRFSQEAVAYNSLIDPESFTLNFEKADIERLYNLADYSVVSRHEFPVNLPLYPITTQEFERYPISEQSSTDQWFPSITEGVPLQYDYSNTDPRNAPYLPSGHPNSDNFQDIIPHPPVFGGFGGSGS